MTEVSAALILKDGRFMICRRPAHKARGLLWEFVGGKVEPGETGEQALIRECREELDVSVSVDGVFTEVVHEYPDITVHLTLYRASLIQGEPRLLEHEDLRWITPQEIPGYEFCPADTEILKKIREEMGPRYGFYGWETADVSPAEGTYPTIRSPRELYDALSVLWSAETCAPRMRKDWTPENRTLGQCSVTAFLAQDVFGGKVYGVPLGDGNFHCYNDAGGCVFDLTSQQFGDKAGELCYENNPEQFREVHFRKEEKRLRYEMLKQSLKELTETGKRPAKRP